MLPDTLKFLVQLARLRTLLLWEDQRYARSSSSLSLVLESRVATERGISRMMERTFSSLRSRGSSFTQCIVTASSVGKIVLGVGDDVAIVEKATREGVSIEGRVLVIERRGDTTRSGETGATTVLPRVARGSMFETHPAPGTLVLHVA